MHSPYSKASRTLYIYFEVLIIMLTVDTVSGVVMSVLDISTVSKVLNINMSSVSTSVVDVITLQYRASYTSMPTIDGPPSFWKGITQICKRNSNFESLGIVWDKYIYIIKFHYSSWQRSQFFRIQVDTFYHELNISILQISLCQDGSDSQELSTY